MNKKIQAVINDILKVEDELERIKHGDSETTISLERWVWQLKEDIDQIVIDSQIVDVIRALSESRK